MSELPAEAITRVWNWLPAFRAVAETEHLPTAARRLYVTPSALSRTIGLLEGELERPLFRRVGRRIRLNEAGQRLLTRVRDAMRLAHHGVQEAREETLAGPLRIYASGILTPIHVEPSIERMRADHPRLVAYLRSSLAPNVANATAFVLTIEPVMDSDPGPAATKILGGDFNAGQATLGVGHGAALGDDFTSATGSFIIATPSSTVMTDEDQGIWWLDPTGPAATLMLPTLPAGWAYEGWVVGGSGPVSTGRFTNPAGPDSDLAGPTGGTDSNGPPFPGQDFVTPPVSLIGQTAVISVEPDPDDSPNPFTLKPLVTMSIGAQLAPTLQAMSNNAAATNPTGTATIQ